MSASNLEEYDWSQLSDVVVVVVVVVGADGDVVRRQVSDVTAAVVLSRRLVTPRPRNLIRFPRLYFDNRTTYGRLTSSRQLACISTIVGSTEQSSTFSVVFDTNCRGLTRRRRPKLVAKFTTGRQRATDGDNAAVSSLHRPPR
jgi:hypothetical protein